MKLLAIIVLVMIVMVLWFMCAAQGCGDFEKEQEIKQKSGEIRPFIICIDPKLYGLMEVNDSKIFEMEKDPAFIPMGSIYWEDTPPVNTVGFFKGKVVVKVEGKSTPLINLEPKEVEIVLKDK